MSTVDTVGAEGVGAPPPKPKPTRRVKAGPGRPNRGVKRGRLVLREKEFISHNRGILPPEEIALRLGRSEDKVINYIRELKQLERDEVNALPSKGGAAPPTMADMPPLRTTVAWTQLCKEFTADELRFFEERYNIYRTQLDEGLRPTEEGQLWKALKYEVLMSRNLAQQRRDHEESERLASRKDELMREPPPPRGTPAYAEWHNLLQDLDARYQAVLASRQAKSKEYRELEANHQSLMEALKATRDQRVKEDTQSKHSFLDLIKMLADRDVAEREGRQIAQMRRAVEQEAARLGRPHKYMDGTIDQPLLSADTVGLAAQDAADDEIESSETEETYLQE